MPSFEDDRTLLAKALFDNLADAPDELSFRKGDIVTVIEQDVDGLVGWWLCLLHGKQGIVPGNRLKIIPPVELDQFERDSRKKRASYETDEFSDSAELIDGAGSNYDFLPAPMKSNNFPPPLSIKDMFDIPYKTNNNNNETSEELYDVPKRQSQEIYDIPKGNFAVEQPETYKVPSSKNSSTATTLQELYDVPKGQQVTDVPLNQEVYDIPSNRKSSGNSGPQEIYDVPKSGYDTPKSTANGFSSLENISHDTLEAYDVPKAESVLDMDKLMGEIYDSPFSMDSNMSTIKRSPKSSSNNTPRNSMNGSLSNVGHSTPNQRHSAEIYDIPKRHSAEVTPGNYSANLSFTNTNNSSQFQSQEIYDTPTSHAHGDSYIKTVYQETYDIPSTKRNMSSAQTLPRGFSPRTQQSKTPQQQKGTRLQEIYDIPNTSLNRNSFGSAPNTPVTERKNISVQGSNTPETNMKASAQKTVISESLYKVPSSQAISDEIYDIPTNNTLRRNEFAKMRETNIDSAQDIYDVPVNHDVSQVMANVSPAYSSHKKRGNVNLAPPGELEDDYMDYHDIWTKEPPKEMIREHANSISSKDSLCLNSSDTVKKRLSSGADHKKSILDQINFEAVKELQITTSEAIERLSKLHLAVDTCVKSLMSFCNERWLEIQVLRSSIKPIRDFSSKLKTALRLLTEFGLGTLVNTTKNVNGEILMDKLIGDVEPLLESYYKVKICLMHLDSNSWTVPHKRTSQNEKFFATLNAIMILSQRIPDQCRMFNLSVQNNANELFNPDPIRDITKQIGTLLIQAQNELAVQPSAVVKSEARATLSAETGHSTGTLRRDTAKQRQQARDAGSGTLLPVPRLPPKPSLPNQRRSLAGTMDTPDSPAINFNNRGMGHIERLVTEYVPENSRQKKYASDPATPSHTEAQKTMWGGSCPILLDRNSAAGSSTMRGADSASSSSSVGASIPEETIEIRQMNSDLGKGFPSDSNILSPGLSPLHTRSASLPWGDAKKLVFSYDDTSPRVQTLAHLDHRDIESLEFFCRQVESQVMLLRESMKNLTEAVENREEPAVFVSHSKFIILTAHKVVNGGQEITERILHQDVKSKLKNGIAHLTICIRGVIASTKTAALEYPEPSAMMEMISSVLALGDAVRIIHSECKRALNA